MFEHIMNKTEREKAIGPERRNTSVSFLYYRTLRICAVFGNRIISKVLFNKDIANIKYPEDVKFVPFD